MYTDSCNVSPFQWGITPFIPLKMICLNGNILARIDILILLIVGNDQGY